MNAKLIMPICILVIISLIFSLCWILTEDTSINPAGSPEKLWELKLENFISDIVCDEKRVYVVDGAIAICLNKNDGSEIWRSNELGSTTRRSKIIIYDDKVYAGTYGGKVTSFNKYTGKKLLQFQAPVSTSWGGKSAPQDFFIEDGRLFVFQNGYAVFNATSGELFYETNGWTLELGNASLTASETDYVFIYGYSRVNPDDGEIIWRLDGGFDGPLELDQDKLILWNYNPNEFLELGHYIIYLDGNSKDVIWSFNVSSPMYSPVVHNDIVLFGAYDGYFYALDLFSGALVWKTFVTDQNNQSTIVGNEGRDLTPIASSIQIDNRTNTGVWSFAFIQNGWGGVIEYVGTACALNINNGNLLWSKPITNNASISGSNLLFPHSIGSALLGDYIFLTVGSDFYIFNHQNGTIIEEKNFDHHLLEPLAKDNRVFVAEELHFVAYKNKQK